MSIIRMTEILEKLFAAPTTINNISTALKTAQHLGVLKTFGAPKAAGAFQSGWRATGLPSVAAAPPVYTAGSGYSCDRTTAGALGQVNAVTQNWLARFRVAMTQPGVLYIADRLWQCSGMGFAASTYAVTTPGSLPARITDGGVGCLAWIENDVAAGAVAGTLTVNYLNQIGGAGAGVVAAPVSAPVAGQMQPVPLAVGDLGVSQIVNCVNSGSWTSGSWGMTILKTYLGISVGGANLGSVEDWEDVMCKIPADASLFFYYLATGTIAPVVSGVVSIIDM